MTIACPFCPFETHHPVALHAQGTMTAHLYVNHRAAALEVVRRYRETGQRFQWQVTRSSHRGSRSAFRG